MRGVAEREYTKKFYKTIVLQAHDFTVIATDTLIENTGNSCQLPAMSAVRY